MGILACTKGPKASDHIDPEEEPCPPEECALGFFVHEAVQPSPLPRTPSSEPPPPRCLLVIRRAQFCGLAVAEDDGYKVEMLRSDRAGMETRLINPSMLVACALLVANLSKAG